MITVELGIIWNFKQRMGISQYNWLGYFPINIGLISLSILAESRPNLGMTIIIAACVFPPRTFPGINYIKTPGASDSAFKMGQWVRQELMSRLLRFMGSKWQVRKQSSLAF
jgi:hypothetical protein